MLGDVDGPPKRNMAGVQHRFRRVKDKSYLKRFLQYREQMETSRERFVMIGRYVKEFLDDARARKVTVHDDDPRCRAMHKTRELG